jgi:uncharacterized membrane protein YgcG
MLTECEVDWVKSGPALVLLIVAVLFIFMRLKNSGFGRRKSHSDDGGGGGGFSRGGGDYYRPHRRSRY